MVLPARQHGFPQLSDDCGQELASALQNAQPKIQKMCEEESDDTEAVNKLFVINDSLNHTLQRYQLIKKGELEAARHIPRGTLGTKTALKAGKDNELSLIDLEDDTGDSSAVGSAVGSSVQSEQVSSVENDLLGLSIGPADPTNNGIYLGMAQPPGKANASYWFPSSAVEDQRKLTYIIAPKPTPTPFTKQTLDFVGLGFELSYSSGKLIGAPSYSKPPPSPSSPPLQPMAKSGHSHPRCRISPTSLQPRR